MLFNTIISKLFKFTVHLTYAPNVLVHYLISKLFKFTVHDMWQVWKENRNKISKLFKFTVHDGFVTNDFISLLFQNFSSLQFIEGAG